MSVYVSAYVSEYYLTIDFPYPYVRSWMDFFSSSSCTHAMFICYRVEVLYLTTWMYMVTVVHGLHCDLTDVCHTRSPHLTRRARTHTRSARTHTHTHTHTPHTHTHTHIHTNKQHNTAHIWKQIKTTARLYITISIEKFSFNTYIQIFTLL